MKKTPIAALLALLLEPLSFSALAQTPGENAPSLPTVTVQESRDAGPAYNPATTTTAAKIAAPLRDIPQTVSVVPQQVIRDQAANSMESVLRTVPGVGLSHGDGQRDQVFIRGFTAIGDQFVDGIRDDALYFRDLSNVERIEVLKGPASVLYGRGSSGGLINRITRKPGLDISEVGVTVGSWNQRRGEFDLGRKLGDGAASFRVTGALESADSYRDQQFLRREALAPSLLLKLAPSTSLLLQMDHLRDERVTDFGIPSFQGRPVNVSPSQYYGAANARSADTSTSEVNSAGFTLDHRFSDKLALRNAFRYYEYTLRRNNTLVGAVNEGAQTARLDHSNVNRDEDGWFNQTELTHKTELAGMKHQFLYGVEVGKQNKSQFFLTQSGVATVNLFNPVLPVLPVAAVGTPGSDNTGIFTTSSAYVQDLVSLSPHWKALAGLRYDRFQQEVVPRSVGPALSRTDNNVSPRAGIVYQPRLDQSYYASVSRSFQPSGEAFPLAANNAQIAPEETTNLEVGAKLDFFDGNASLNTSLFNLKRTNIKFTDPATNTLVPVGTQRTQGLEVSFTGELPHGWNIWSGYAWLNSKVIDSPAVDSGQTVLGKQATLTPRHSASLWLNKKLAAGWRAGAGLSYVGDRFANPGNTVTLPAYTRLDAMLGYALSKWDLQLNINNLLNRAYIVSGHGSSPNLNLPGAPRNAVLTARYKF